MTYNATVSRCANCGAPLPSEHDGNYRLNCPYCEFENVLVAQVQGDAQAQAARLDQIAKETEAWEKDLEPQIADLEAKFAKAMDDQAYDEAIRYQEGAMRLQMAPTIRQFQAIAAELGDAAAAQIEAAIAQCDVAVDDAMSSLAAKLGVEYVPTAERLKAQTG